MKKIILFIIIVNNLFTITAQTQVSGNIKDTKGLSLVGANIYIKDSYDGATTDLDGEFIFNTSTTGVQTLVIQYIGYKSVEKNINLTKDNTSLSFMLVENTSTLEAVVLTAGSFDARDEKKQLF